eukprot:Skav206473  [mRNA]  locus=scaffold1672:225551:231286:- [translate_table: standard]
MMIVTANGSELGGILADPAHGTHNGHAEHHAMTWALIWAVQIAKWHRLCYPTSPSQFCFNFDAVTTASLAGGTWAAHVDGDWKRLMRALELLLRSHCGDAIAWNHVYAHQGHLLNEGADSLAKFAAKHLLPYEHPFKLWLQPTFLQSLAWAWTLPLGLPVTPGSGTHPVLVSPPNVSPADLDTQVPQDDGCVDSVIVHHELWLRLATANVLTVGQDVAVATDREPVVGARQTLLIDQFLREKFHVIGIQETRHRNQTFFETDHVIGLAHPALPSGHEGIQLWFNKRDRFCADSRPFARQDLLLVSSAPDSLVVRVQHPVLRCLVICCHAPHSARPPEDLHPFWEELSRCVAKYSHLPILFLGDSNAHLGSSVSEVVGDVSPAQENLAGQLFHDWCLSNRVYLPSTFPACHHGPSFTCLYPGNRGGARLDYVGLPCDVSIRSVRSWVSDSIGISTTRIDHFVACCECAWICTRSLTPPCRKPPVIPSFSDPLFRQAFQSLWNLHPFVPSPCLDVHAHADALSHHIRNIALQATRGMGLRPVNRRKRHISLDTWRLVDYRRWLCRLIRQCRSVPPTQRASLGDVDSLCSQYKWISQAVKQAIQAEDRAFFIELASRAGNTCHRHGLQGLWKSIRHLLPKGQRKRAQARFDMHDAPLQHFETLEAGVTQPISHARAATVAHQCRNFQPPAGVVQLEQIPSVLDTELQCLKQRPGKAAGPDGLILLTCSTTLHLFWLLLSMRYCVRSVLSGCEPHSFKGGRLVSLYKHKGSKQDPASYRGILVASVAAKLFQGWLRTHVLPTFLATRESGQIGGVPGCQPQTGIHLIQLHAKVARARRLSSAVVFVDLRAAFHHMARQWIFNAVPCDHHQLLSSMLDSRDFDVEDIAALLAGHSSPLQHSMPPLLFRLLNDVHSGTWFNLADPTVPDSVSPRVTVTTRGTRPGSPLADVCFNIFMTQALRAITSQLQALPLVQAGNQAAQCDMPPITWVDDIAVPLFAASPSDLVPLVQQVVGIVHDQMSVRGMTVNYSKNKTAVALMFRGQGSTVHRTAVFGLKSSGVILVHARNHLIQLPVVATYRHLGAQYHMDNNVDIELAHRLSAARQAFADAKRSLFLNRSIPCKARLTLFHSLITSRLFYGAAVWLGVTPQHIKRVDSALMRMLRQLIGNGFWSPEVCVPDAALRAQFDLPPFRLTLAKLRLTYLPVVARFGLSVYLDALLIDNRANQGWLQDVRTDLEWLYSLLPLPFELPENTAEGWRTFFAHVAGFQGWMPWIKRAFARHMLQEKVAHDTQHLHELVLQELQEQQRICPCVPSAPVAVDKPFVCDEAFVDRRLLAQHRFRAHSLHSEESMLIHSTRCGGCLRNFHTSHRMLQHLKYHPNGCLWKLRTFRLPDTPHKASLPDHLKRVARLPCERDVAGPLLPDPAQHARSQLLTKLWHLKNHPWFPIVCSVSCESLSWLPSLTRALDSTSVPTRTSSAALVHSWLDSCLQLVCDYTDDHLRGGIALFQWIDRCFAGHFAHRPSESTLLQCSDAELIALDLPSVTPSSPSSPAAPSSTRVSQGCGPVPSRFALLADWERTYRDAWQVCVTPIPATVRVTLQLVVHLYSGRRRRGDFQWWMEGFLASHHPHVVFLSIDTAIHNCYNVLQGGVWSFLMAAASHGAIAVLLCGPPCESWSAARALPLLDHVGQVLRGPRPLRDRTRPWGRDMLYAKELSQLHIGTVLLLMALRLAVRVAHTQGRVIVEHPGVPFDDAQASIWWTQLLDLLTDGCGLFSVMDIQQFRFGSPAVKPTRLLFANLPLQTVLPQLERRDFVRPTTVLAGRRSDGSFATSIAKEYPRLLNLALALCCSRNFPEQTGEVSDELVQKAREFSHFCRDTGGTIQPDYQPQAVALHV